MTDSSLPDAWVVFSGRTDLPWLRILKPGFRHCYVLMNDGHSWISIDPMSHYTDVTVHYGLAPSFDLPGWMRARGHVLLRAATARALKPAPCRPFTCVEAVKRVIGVHAPFVFTPWQLYHYLAKEVSSPSYNQGELSWEV